MTILKQLRDRTKTIGATQKITKAMQTIAASKFRKIKDILPEVKNYAQIVTEACIGVLSHLQDENLTDKEKLVFGIKNSNNKNKDDVVLVIILSSERGLCGSFNSNLIRKLKEDIKLSSQDFRLLIFGKKAYDYLKKDYNDRIVDYQHIYSSEIATAVKLQQRILQIVKDNSNFTICKIYYNKFINVIKQEPDTLTLFPISNYLFQQIQYSYEFEGEMVVEQIIDLYFLAILFRTIVIHRLSEEGSRMTAMDNATISAGDMIEELTLKLNQVRQAGITKELIEIISGAEAIK